MRGRRSTRSTNSCSEPDDFPGAAALIEGIESAPMPMGDGRSVICGPAGQVLAAAELGQEEIIYADLDQEAITAARMMRNQGGHYHRSDVFDLHVDRTRRIPATFGD